MCDNFVCCLKLLHPLSRIPRNSGCRCNPFSNDVFFAAENSSSRIYWISLNKSQNKIPIFLILSPFSTYYSDDLQSLERTKILTPSRQFLLGIRQLSNVTGILKHTFRDGLVLVYPKASTLECRKLSCSRFPHGNTYDSDTTRSSCTYVDPSFEPTKTSSISASLRENMGKLYHSPTSSSLGGWISTGDHERHLRQSRQRFS